MAWPSGEVGFEKPLFCQGLEFWPFSGQRHLKRHFHRETGPMMTLTPCDVLMPEMPFFMFFVSFCGP